MVIRIRIQIQLRILSSSSKNSKKNLDFFCFVTSLWLFTSVPDPHPDPLVSVTDPRIRICIRIRTKISQIPNTDHKRRIECHLFEQSCSAPDTDRDLASVLFFRGFQDAKIIEREKLLYSTLTYCWYLPYAIYPFLNVKSMNIPTGK